jgi:hypothetical protein
LKSGEIEDRAGLHPRPGLKADVTGGAEDQIPIRRELTFQGDDL